MHFKHIRKKVTNTFACFMIATGLVLGSCNVHAQNNIKSEAGPQNGIKCETQTVSQDQIKEQVLSSEIRIETQEEVVIPAEKMEGENVKVSYTRSTITKGGYTTKIWNQHYYWSAKSSAARHGCGICATAMVLQLKGKDYTPNDVLKQNGRSTKRCSAYTAQAASNYLKKKGLNPVIYNTKKYSRETSGDIMAAALKSGKLVMALVSGAPFSHSTHWIVLTGYNASGKIVVANSSNGYHNICVNKNRQYQLVTMKQIYKKLNRGNSKWSYYIVV